MADTNVQAAKLPHLPTVKTIPESMMERQKTNVSFKNSKGKDVSYNLYVGDNKAVFDAINKFSTKESPNITPEKLFEMNEFVYDTTHLANTGGHAGSIYVDTYDRLIKHYTDKNSPGGENITPEEQTLLMEKLAKTYGTEVKSK